jgi:hypothetical protein
MAKEIAGIQLDTWRKGTASGVWIKETQASYMTANFAGYIEYSYTLGTFSVRVHGVGLPQKLKTLSDAMLVADAAIALENGL